MFSINVGFIINGMIVDGKAHSLRECGSKGQKGDGKGAGQVWLVWIALQGKGKVVGGITVGQSLV